MTMCLAGYATRYNKIIHNAGDIVMLLPGVFSELLTHSRFAVKLLRDHEDSAYLGSSKNILELFDDGDVGLAFRVTGFPDTEVGRDVRRMATIAKYDSVSIGWDYHGAEKQIRRIEGLDVECVINASLFEVSICAGYNAGAVKDSFAMYGDFDNLQDECRSGRLLYEGAAVGIRRAVRKFEMDLSSQAQDARESALAAATRKIIARRY